MNLDSFFEKYEAVKPYLIPSDPTPEREGKQIPEERAVFDETIRCILCGCCTAA